MRAGGRSAVMGGLAAFGVVTAAILVLTGDQPAAAQASDLPQAGGRLSSFRSERELKAFLDKRTDVARQQVVYNMPVSVAPSPMVAPPPPPPAPEMDESSDVVVTGSRVSNSTLSSANPVTTVPGNRKITNTQEEDVDEGGIVKAVGDKLVVLRRGRIFTIDTAGGRLRALDHIDASPPGVSGDEDWYDEMLVKGDRIVVVGFSYDRGGTEVNRFRMTPDGKLRFEDAYHLRSNDYYSSRNYASRLVGDRLVYYTPLDLGSGDDDWSGFPGMRRWTGDADAPFKTISTPRRTFIVRQMRDNPEAVIDTVHSVVDCDLTAPTMKCDATAVLGPASRVFYVSGSAVYLWVSDAWHGNARRRGGVRSFVYRLPLNGAEAPSAVAARGAPSDQFSFREDRRNGLLDVLVRSDGGGDAMWNPGVGEGDVALLSIPFGSFGSGSREVSLGRYRALPDGGNGYNFRNRFVGDHILYASTVEDGRGQIFSKFVAAALRGGPVATFSLPYEVSRIEQMGRDGVVIGTDSAEALAFTAFDLGRGLATLQDRFVMPAASEGESRSQAFFYRPDNADGSNGVLGLPISRPVDEHYREFFGRAASLLFLKRDQRKLSMAGELAARVEGTVDDGCKASCVDWYGNARPIFWDRDRVIALLGYELVEGRLNQAGRIAETDRLSFAPNPREARRQ